MTILVKTKMKKDMNKLARIFIPEEDQVHRKMARSIMPSSIMMIHEVAIMIEHISGNSNRRMMRYTLEWEWLKKSRKRDFIRNRQPIGQPNGRKRLLSAHLLQMFQRNEILESVIQLKNHLNDSINNNNNLQQKNYKISKGFVKKKKNVNQVL